MQVGATTRDFGYQRICCLLDAVVEEPIGTLRLEDESGSDRFPKEANVNNVGAALDLANPAFAVAPAIPE